MLVAIIAMCCSCKGNPKTQSVTVEDCVVIPFESVIENEHEVLLSNLAEKVEYIPLQTDSNCLVGNCWENNIIRSKKYYFLADGNNLFQYSLSGKFVRNIGSVGQGPVYRLIGFTAEQTATLVVGTPLQYSGKLHSEEHGRSFAADRVVAQIGTEPTDKHKLFLSINRIHVSNWFKEQFDRLNQSIQVKPEHKKSRGIRL